jgi:NADPH:quinone reductase-like Zn-dependent oxidoreductase
VSTSTFRAAVVRTPDGPDSIEIVDVPVRDPGPGEIRVAVAAASVNPVDLGVAGGTFHEMGLVHQPEWTGLGWDFAGTVAATGPGVDLAVGDRVAGLVVGFDRDHGTYAEQLVVAAGDVAVVPDGLDLVAAATVPLNGLAAAQIVDLLGDAPGDDGNRLLVTGAAGAVGGYVALLARDRGWQVTGLGRAHDEAFVRRLGVEFTTHAEPGWDAVADAAVLQERGVALVRDGGVFVGVRPGGEPPAERGITVAAVETHPDADRLGDLLARTAAGELPARVHAVVPLDDVADAHRAVAKGGVRGRYVLAP